MTRKQIKRILECLHMLLLFVMILPIIYMIGMQRETGMIYRLYWAGYLLLVPFMGFKLAEEHCKRLWQYLLVCIGISIGIMAIAVGISHVLLTGKITYGYFLYIFIGLLTGVIKEYASRMKKVRRQRAKEEMDSSWGENDSFMDKPQMRLSALFILIYVIALNFACPEVCNIAVISTVCHLMIAISYQYIVKMEHYLAMNEGVCKVRNIPYKRLFGIGKAFLLSYLVLILLTVIPAWLTTGFRQYKDYREWVLQREVYYEDLFEYEQTQSGGGDPMQDLIASYGPVKDTPIILKVILYAIGAFGACFLLGIAIRWIYGEIKDFARNVEEEDDRVEMLEEQDREEKLAVGRFTFKKSEGDKIRSRYRKFIRKHRKDRPASYETPEEIERAAGVVDMVEGRELHQQYEEVRYGR